MIAKILIALVVLVECFAIQFWVSCMRFHDAFYFSAFDVQLKVTEQINNDVGYSVELVRVFHNKFFVGASELFNKYLFFWDTHFQALFFSLVGMFGIFCGFWYLAKSKKRRIHKWIIISILLGLPFLEIFSSSQSVIIELLLLWFPYASLSFYGLWAFLKPHHGKRRLFIVLLLFISVWYLLAFQGDNFLFFCYNK